MNWISLLSAWRHGDEKPRDPNANKQRSLFEQDHDRILFSSSFRKLQDKTQVIPLPEEDFVHNRLTHSIEVSSVGRTLGQLAGQQLIEKYPSLAEVVSSSDIGYIVAAASLCHDIGNPPFGHSGEAAIGEYFLNGNGRRFQNELTEGEWADLTRFEGNANGFRMMVKGKEGGLRLTYPTLAAFMKYPKLSVPVLSNGRASEKKFGSFHSECEQLFSIASRLNMMPANSGVSGHYRRHPLAFLVEAADDLCYHIIDFEDGIRLGWVLLKDAEELLIPLAGKSFIFENYQRLSETEEKAAYLRATAINGLIREASDIFMEHESDMLNGTFDEPLLKRSKHAGLIRQIKDLSVERIYRHRSVVEIEAAGFEVIGGLLDLFVHALLQQCGEGNSARNRKIAELLPPALRNPSEEVRLSRYLQLLCVCEFVAGLTDRHAIGLYRKLRGIELPNG